MSTKKFLYHLFHPTEKSRVLSRAFEFFLIIIIILNIFAIILNSVKEIHTTYGEYLHDFELFSVVFFTLEYIARIYSITESARYHHPVRGRFRYAMSGMAMVDLLAFLPFYLTFFSVDMMFIRIVRLMGLFRMFKIARFLHALNIFKKVINERKEQLILSIIFILFVLVLISSIMYYVEHGAQPELFSSIPATMWWGVCTLTTVGYGDMVPVTYLGKFLGGMFAIIGIGLFALPAGILSSGFFDQIRSVTNKKTCPHCGKDFHG